jgi:DinB superfamily
MTETERIVRELEEAHAGTPWHGPSRTAVLADVTFDEAARRPGREAHGIWELVLHMRAWTAEVARRIREGNPGEPAEGDFPAPPPPSAAAWAAAKSSLDTAHRDLVAAIRAAPTGFLDARGGSIADTTGGIAVSNRVMLHGLAQHDAYHSGQIALLKRIYRGGPTS